MSSLKMFISVFFFIALFGVASSKLPHVRKCEPEPREVGPTLCSNYKNIQYLDKEKETLRNNQRELEQRIKEVEKQTNKIDGLVMDLEKMKSNTQKNFRDMKTQLKNYRDDIESLQKDVQVMARHRETVRGNFNEIEERLNATERLLREKKTKLENLEAQTETAFNDTQTLMNRYKRELSHLNATAQKLEDKVNAKFENTTTKLEAQLNKIQATSEAFSTKLNEQKTETNKLKGETERKFRNVDEQLKTQNTTLSRQKSDSDTLKKNIAGLAIRLKSAEEDVEAQKTLKAELDTLKARDNAKVAFSATVQESNGVFTGPRTPSTTRTLIFNRVFTNVGNAYNRKTGTFTAPLEGVYHFSFMTFGYNTYSSGAILVKNGHYQVSTWEFKGPDSSDTTSNTVILNMKAGDCINIFLWQGGKIHMAVFSGFLIFSTS